MLTHTAVDTFTVVAQQEIHPQRVVQNKATCAFTQGIFSARHSAGAVLNTTSFNLLNTSDGAFGCCSAATLG